MTKHMTRRAALAAGASTLALAVPAAAIAAPAIEDPDAGLHRLYARLEILETEANSLIAESDRIVEDTFAARPMRPEWEGVHPTTRMEDPEYRAFYWERLRAAKEAGQEEVDRRAREVSRQSRDVLRKIEDTPARTPRGLLYKARAARLWSAVPDGEIDDLDSEGRMFFALLRDLEQMVLAGG